MAQLASPRRARLVSGIISPSARPLVSRDHGSWYRSYALNKRLRSRVLAASIVSTTLVGAGIPLIPLQSAHAQDRPSAEAQLNRGQALYDQKNYSEAKRILTD